MLSTYRAAATLVGLGDVELIDAIVRGCPEGIRAMRPALAAQVEVLPAGREQVVIRIIRDMLRRHLDT